MVLHFEILFLGESMNRIIDYTIHRLNNNMKLNYL